MKVLGISAGNGAILFPFRKYLIGNIEVRSLFHSVGERQWVINYQNIPLLRQISSEFKPDVIISHPDCGHSSVLRFSRAKKLVNAQGNHSLKITMEGINYYKPKIFLIENLPGLLNTHSKEDFKRFFKDYKLYFQLNSVIEYGNSQFFRKRLVIIGIKDDIFQKNRKKCKKFRKPFKVRRPKRAGMLIDDLEYPNFKFGHVRELDNTKICMYYKGQKLNFEQVRNLWNTEFKSLRRWPGQGKMNNQPGVYRDRYYDWPATVRKQNRAFNFRGETLSPRECARINGISDNFKIYLEQKKLTYWLNKARVTVTKCPPMEISIWLKKVIQKTKILEN